MAIKFNTYTIGNRKNINADMAKTSMTMNYTLNTESTWINCNYPEHLTSTSMLGDSNLGNKCIFTGEVKPGIVQVFYSHFNETGGNINYGIQYVLKHGRIFLKVMMILTANLKQMLKVYFHLSILSRYVGLQRKI